VTPGEAVVGGLRLAGGVEVPAGELQWRFSASGGAGGQHVNTSNTRVEVRFDVARSASLPEPVRQRLRQRLGPQVTVVTSDRRSQARNRQLAVERLTERLNAALHNERPRRPTRPTAASQRRRLDAKRRQSARKAARRRAGGDDG
jgi:ribosome-associated protein